jgi:hypothetical protein
MRRILYAALAVIFVIAFAAVGHTERQSSSLYTSSTTVQMYADNGTWLTPQEVQIPPIDPAPTTP